MYESAAKLLKEKGFKMAQIRLHGEVDATSCPGKYFDKNMLARYLEKEWRGSMKDYEGRWSEGVIDRVKRLGVMEGYPDGSFKPTQPVTREELAVVAVRILELKGDDN